jgi:hypothetical protein
MSKQQEKLRQARFDYITAAIWTDIIDSPLTLEVKEFKAFYKFRTKEGWWTLYPKKNVLMKDSPIKKYEKGYSVLLKMFNFKPR